VLDGFDGEEESVLVEEVLQGCGVVLFDARGSQDWGGTYLKVLVESSLATTFLVISAEAKDRV